MPWPRSEFVAEHCSSTLKLCKCLPWTLQCNIIPRTFPLTTFFTGSQKDWSKLQKNPLRAKKRNKISSELRTCLSHSLLDSGLQSSHKYYYTLAFLLTLFHSHQLLASVRDKTEGWMDVRSDPMWPKSSLCLHSPSAFLSFKDKGSW